MRACQAHRHLIVAALALLAAQLAACAARHPPPQPAPRVTGARCLSRLAQEGVRFALAAEPASAGACQIDTPVRVSAAGIAWNQPGLVSCAFALDLAEFARRDVEAAAVARFGEPVRLIRHFGTYACRHEDGGNRRWSQHASGRAIDLAGFELADGTVIDVRRDWRRHGAKSAFLHEVARRACRRFALVLTPDSDAEHYNHIHIDDGPYRRCGA